MKRPLRFRSVARVLKFVLIIQGCCVSHIHAHHQGVYKTLQTKGDVGTPIARFITNINPPKPVFHVVELDLYRGESITITCPSDVDTVGSLFPANLTRYYTSPPCAPSYLDVTFFTNSDLENELLTCGDENFGTLDDVSDSLILVEYGHSSRRLSFIWNGGKVKRRSTLYYLCLKKIQEAEDEEYIPSALIAVNVIPDAPSMRNNIININNLTYVPPTHDVIYTKEFASTENLTVQCWPKVGNRTIERWKPMDVEVLEHNILHHEVDGKVVLNPSWEESVSLVNVKINLREISDGTLTVKSQSIASMIYLVDGMFYLGCLAGNYDSTRIFNLVPSTVSAIEHIKPSIREVDEGESFNEQDDIYYFQYKVTHARAVSMFCPMETHTLEPRSLLTSAKSKFDTEVSLSFPNTRISTRGNSLVVVDFSNTSALDDVRLQISCQSRSPNYTSYVFSLTNRMMCLFGDTKELWQPCKVVLFPSDEVTIRCPRKTEHKYYPLKPEDMREGYIKVDDDFIRDRHPALSRTVIANPTGDLHKITFNGHDKRTLMRDEIHYECSDEEYEKYTTTESRAIVIIKLVGNYEEIDTTGKITIPISDLLKPTDGPRLFHIFLGAGMTQRIQCSDFFVDNPRLTLYPKGEWEVFDDIPRFFAGMLMDKIPGRKVFATRAMYGLTIAKYARENPSYVDMTLSADYKLSSRSDNAMYFLCARNTLWDDVNSDVAVVQVYIQSNTTKSFGVGVEKGLFRLEYVDERNSYNDATFNIANHDFVAMHCPKGPGETNLPACHTNIMAAFGRNKKIEEFANHRIIDGYNYQGFKSLWYISTEGLKAASHYGPVEVDCYCRDENNAILAVAHLTSISGFLCNGLMISVLSIIFASIGIATNT
ncbi:uncharacterized protein BXIN_1201 [Babesia sp. Xinjiang]|uniref:uncharacterized protein n=1 Tax=Babesia sp. Xinjiang TaxID=462227 RepID=UPI000A217B3E|nr:uncharacterized protein BXIN_1201 [Babesia sp. Xinjiang]ORM40124.1 hypothetical protein BXIN_1201 [Babesia sp. Xinjiang]